MMLKYHYSFNIRKNIEDKAIKYISKNDFNLLYNNEIGKEILSIPILFEKNNNIINGIFNKYNNSWHAYPTNPKLVEVLISKNDDKNSTKDTSKNGPAYVESIKTDADFLNIQERGMNEKWWFAFDSKCVLDNDTDKMTKYSFSQLNELYEEKAKKLEPKSIKKCAEVLQNRCQLKIEVNLLSNTFQNLLMKQANLQEKEENIIEVQKQIEEMQKKIRNFDNQSKALKPEELVKKLEELNNEINDKLNNLNNETIVEYINSCEYDKYHTYTHCDCCQRNCHNFYDCFGNSLGRCKRFTWGILGDKNAMNVDV